MLLLSRTCHIHMDVKLSPEIYEYISVMIDFRCVFPHHELNKDAN